MRVLIVRTACRGGIKKLGNVNSIEIGLARGIVGCGHICDIVYYGGRESYEVDASYFVESVKEKIHLYVLKAFPLYDSSLFFGLAKIAQDYDLIIPLEYDQVESWRLARKFPEKVVIYHGTYYSEFNKRYNLKCKLVDRLFLGTYKKRKTKFVTKSPLAAEFLVGKGLQSVKTVGMGIDIEQLDSGGSSKNPFAERLIADKTKGCKLLLYVGHVEPRRCTIELVSFFEKLTEVRDDVKLVIVGKPNANYREAFLGKVESSSVKDRICYIEQLPQNDLPAVYKACDVFLLPTRYEIFGRVLMEAMLYGLPVVTTKNGGSSMLVENGVNGLIMDDFNVESWSNAILKALRLAERGEIDTDVLKDRIASRFSWLSVADKIVSSAYVD